MKHAMEPTCSRFWSSIFLSNEHRREAQVPRRLVVPEGMHAPLLRALMTFQAGETGEGRIVGQAARVAPDDPDFLVAMRLYVAEEGRHARELGALVRALGGEPRAEMRTAKAFRVARRLAGFRTKMLVLAAAEAVGIVFYDLLAERVPCPPLVSVVARISREEHRHLAFQHAYFESLGSPRLSRVAMESATLAAALAFTWDQQALLRALGVSRREVFARALRLGRGPGAVPASPSPRDAGPQPAAS